LSRACTSEVSLRTAFAAELEQLRLQVEVMGLRVDQNLERMRDVLVSGSTSTAGAAIAADDEIDAMNVSLTERCYDLLIRENPMASDLRLVVSVVRVTGEYERIGDLALRVVKLAPERAMIASSERSYDILLVMVDEAIELFRTALRAWGDLDLAAATDLARGSRGMDLFNEQITETLLGLEGPDAVAIALRTMTVGRALDRIADHTAILGSRMRYLITGDPGDLAAEVR
jgi:phosphate transport system protein